MNAFKDKAALQYEPVSSNIDTLLNEAYLKDKTASQYDACFQSEASLKDKPGTQDKIG
jgi:hypothetical protein